MPGTDRQPSHASSCSAYERRHHRVDQHGKRNNFGIGVARVLVDPENDDPQADTDLRCSKSSTIEMSHSVLHIEQQGVEFRRAEGLDGLADRQQPGVAHLENVAYCHGSGYLIGLFHVSLCLAFYT